MDVPVNIYIFAKQRQNTILISFVIMTAVIIRIRPHIYLQLFPSMQSLGSPSVAWEQSHR